MLPKPTPIAESMVVRDSRSVERGSWNEQTCQLINTSAGVASSVHARKHTRECAAPPHHTPQARNMLSYNTSLQQNRGHVLEADRCAFLNVPVDTLNVTPKNSRMSRRYLMTSSPSSSEARQHERTPRQAGRQAGSHRKKDETGGVLRRRCVQPSLTCTTLTNVLSRSLAISPSQSPLSLTHTRTHLAARNR